MVPQKLWLHIIVQINVRDFRENPPFSATQPSFCWCIQDCPFRHQNKETHSANLPAFAVASLVVTSHNLHPSGMMSGETQNHQVIWGDLAQAMEHSTCLMSKYGQITSQTTNFTTACFGLPEANAENDDRIMTFLGVPYLQAQVLWTPPKECVKFGTELVLQSLLDRTSLEHLLEIFMENSIRNAQSSCENQWINGLV